MVLHETFSGPPASGKTSRMRQRGAELRARGFVVIEIEDGDGTTGAAIRQAVAAAKRMSSTGRVALLQTKLEVAS